MLWLFQRVATNAKELKTMNNLELEKIKTELELHVPKYMSCGVFDGIARIKNHLPEEVHVSYNLTQLEQIMLGAIEFGKISCNGWNFSTYIWSKRSRLNKCEIVSINHQSFLVPLIDVNYFEKIKISEYKYKILNKKTGEKSKIVFGKKSIDTAIFKAKNLERGKIAIQQFRNGDALAYDVKYGNPQNKYYAKTIYGTHV